MEKLFKRKVQRGLNKQKAAGNQGENKPMSASIITSFLGAEMPEYSNNVYINSKNVFISKSSRDSYSVSPFVC